MGGLQVYGGSWHLEGVPDPADPFGTTVNSTRATAAGGRERDDTLYNDPYLATATTSARNAHTAAATTYTNIAATDATTTTTFASTTKAAIITSTRTADVAATTSTRTVDASAATASQEISQSKR